MILPIFVLDHNFRTTRYKEAKFGVYVLLNQPYRFLNLAKSKYRVGQKKVAELLKLKNNTLYIKIFKICFKIWKEHKKIRHIKYISFKLRVSFYYSLFLIFIFNESPFKQRKSWKKLIVKWDAQFENVLYVPYFCMLFPNLKTYLKKIDIQVLFLSLNNSAFFLSDPVFWFR